MSLYPKNIGFTLIEALITAVIGFFVISAGTIYVLNLSSTMDEINSQQVLQQESNMALETIKNEVRKGNKLCVMVSGTCQRPSSGTLSGTHLKVLDTGSTVLAEFSFAGNGNPINMIKNSTTTNLSSRGVNWSNLTFTLANAGLSVVISGTISYTGVNQVYNLTQVGTECRCRN